MYKIFKAADWRNVDESQPQILKVSSRGLMPDDARNLRKVAGDHFTEMIRNLEPEKGFKLAHQIALANEELFGHNRNGDAWSDAELRKSAKTFEKFGMAFRNHKANGPVYGRVKLAHYDPELGYVRLVTGYFDNPKTASLCKNGAVADLEIDDLESGRDFAVSMGCDPQYDQCVICGNKATKRAEYCDSRDRGGKCELFGCRSGLTKLSDDGRIQYVTNSGSKFFDISRVDRGAERTAFASPIPEEFLKTARDAQSSAPVLGSAYMAEKIGAELRYDLFDADNLSPYQRQASRLIGSLAKSEEEAQRFAKLAQWEDFSQGLYVDMLNGTNIATGSASTKSANAAGLSAMQICVSFKGFAKQAGLSEDEISVAETRLPTLFRDICRENGVNRLVSNTDYVHNGLLKTASFSARVSSLSLSRDDILDRSLTRMISNQPVRSVHTKLAGELTEKAERCLNQYAAYKLAFCMEQTDPDVVFAAVLQNLVTG